MEISGAGKSPNSGLSFRYNANNEELEELYNVCEDDPPTPQCDVPSSTQSENTSPKRGDKTSSIIEKYFKSIREKPDAEKADKSEDTKSIDSKASDESKTPAKEVSSSPMKDYFNRLGKRSSSEVEVKAESNETWKIFHDFKFKISQAVEDMKTRSQEETKEKYVPRENSTSDSEDNSVVKDSDQPSIGDTDNQVSSLDSSMQNLSEVTQPLTAKATEQEIVSSTDNRNNSESSDDTHKNIGHSDSAELSREYNILDANMEVESGVEALEDTLDGFGDVTNSDTECQNKHSNPLVENSPTPPPLLPSNFGVPPVKNNMNKNDEKNISKNYFFNFTVYFVVFLLFVSYILFPNSNVWNGFLLGILFYCLASGLKNWLLDTFFSDNEPRGISFMQVKKSSAMPPTYTIPSVKEHRPMKKYNGWINHYRFPDYDPYTYHINKTTTSFMKLEGCNLRISYTRTKIAKRELWNEKIENIVFYQHRLYNLTGARITLLPQGLVRRRQWSKKYPICIILSDKEKIQVLEKENAEAEKKSSEAATKKGKEAPEVETAEANTSPEKKRKFVWRRREKSVSHSDGETGKEGLRHRLVRKMHREKKPDTVASGPETNEGQQERITTQDEVVFHDAETDLTKSGTSTKEDGEEDLDENEISRIKDFLEEAVSTKGVTARTQSRMAAREQETSTVEGAAESEWTVHVKRSANSHSRLYLFARTGRDKHEWYRRLTIAIAEASPSPDSSAADEKSPSEAPADNKDVPETTVYKISKDDAVQFNKTLNKINDSVSEGVTIQTASPSHRATQSDMECYEKTFWPYLFKILQPKPPSPTCNCRLLPSEVTWVNTMLARVIYDVMRDPVLIARLQNKIQRKLQTLKLPSFMSPLVVTELSLSGACPLVERVAAPAWDERGVWLDADVRYDGGAYIAILTQINLMKLKEKNMTLEDQMTTTTENDNETDIKPAPQRTVLTERQLWKRKPAVYDSDVEDSAESSSDDESPPMQPVDSNVTMPDLDTGLQTEPGQLSSKKKFLKMVDKIATNKYFQQVTDYKYVKKAMEGLSNTDIKLQLEVHGLEGRLVLNLPPPPHDRLWLGFRSNPSLVLKARPAVGARTLRFAQISNWIERKLLKEFEKVLVLPNMEDFIIGVMTPTPIDFQ